MIKLGDTVFFAGTARKVNPEQAPTVKRNTGTVGRVCGITDNTEIGPVILAQFPQGDLLYLYVGEYSIVCKFIEEEL